MALGLVAALLVFVAVTALVLGIFSSGRDRAAESRLDRLSKPSKEKSPASNILKRDSGTFSFLGRLLSGGWAGAA